jgi:hypothetical protein
MNGAVNDANELISGLSDARANLLKHRVYESIVDLQALQRFAEIHVFAVFDFMSLLKSLQRELTCTAIPWVPVGDAETRFLINEIVVGEESDVDLEGNRISHFELYLNAMREMGASTTQIESFVDSISTGQDVFKSIDALSIDERVKDFLKFTLEISLNAPAHVKAAVFTFGREDIIPEMFIRILDEIGKDSDSPLNTFRYYIERHIEMDGGHHKALAHRMVERLCGNDPEKWREAEVASKLAIAKRIALWDSVVDAISLKAHA